MMPTFDWLLLQLDERLARIKQLEEFVAEVADGFCLMSNAGCHPQHPDGQCRVCRARELLGLPQDADGVLRQERAAELARRQLRDLLG